MKIKNLVTGTLVTALTITSLGIGVTTSVYAEGSDGNPMYRLYNPNSGEHFYTASVIEKNNVVKAGWTDEGISWLAPDEGKDVYRLYNPNAGDHHYTTDEAEKDMLVDYGWNYEGVGWKSADTGDTCETPLYRLYNPNAVGAGSHHYTLSESEKDYLASIGWNCEGTCWSSTHDFVLEGIIEATCISEGYTGNGVCGKCNKVLFKGIVTPVDIDNHKHVTREFVGVGENYDCIHCAVCNSTIDYSDIANEDHNYNYYNAAVAHLQSTHGYQFNWVYPEVVYDEAKGFFREDKWAVDNAMAEYGITPTSMPIDIYINRCSDCMSII